MVLNEQLVIKNVIDFYCLSFFENNTGKEYLVKNRITGDLLSRFKAGFSDGRLLNTLPKDDRHELTGILNKTGILNADGSEYFLNCVTFPVYDENDCISAVYGLDIVTSEQKCIVISGTHTHIWNWDCLKSSKDILIAGRLLDAIYCYSFGKMNVILLSDGYQKLFKQYRTEKVYLCILDTALKCDLKEQLNPIGMDIIEMPLEKPLSESVLSQVEFNRIIKNAETGYLAALEPKISHKDDSIFLDFGKRYYRIKWLTFHNLEKLRVNIKVQEGDFYHLDTIDLYSAKARAAFISHTRKTIHVTERELSKEFSSIIHVLEKTRADNLNIKLSEPKDGITDEERDQAITCLKSPSLLQDIVSDMETLGMIGENSNKAIAYLVSISRKLDAPLSCVIISHSGAGKSVLAETLECITTEEDVLLFSRLSPAALYYMEQDALKHKLLILEEKQGNGEIDYTIKTLQSRKKLTTAIPVKDPDTGRIKTAAFAIYGPIAYVEVTSKSKLKEENTSRCFELFLDTSESQTRLIHKYQRAMKSLEGLSIKLKQSAVARKHHVMQKLLREVRIVNPFTNLIEFPAKWLKTRRTHLLFLNLIEAVTFCYQYQREVKRTSDNVEYIESTVEDYRLAYGLAKDVLCEGFRELKKPERKLISAIEPLIKEEKELTRGQIRETTGLADYQLRKILEELVKLEYLIPVEGKQGQKYRYKLADNYPQKKEAISGLTSPEELEQKAQQKS